MPEVAPGIQWMFEIFFPMMCVKEAPLVETNESTQEVGKYFDSISICLSKGLGAPVGSLLIGKTDFIKKARRIRKVMGGGMRQAGYLAAAGNYALDNHVERLKEDNQRAKILGELLASKDWVKSVRPVKTNIVIFDLKSPFTADQFLDKINKEGIKAAPFGPSTVRFVTHLNYTEEMLERTLKIIDEYE